MVAVRVLAWRPKKRTYKKYFSFMYLAFSLTATISLLMFFCRYPLFVLTTMMIHFMCSEYHFFKVMIVTERVIAQIVCVYLDLAFFGIKQ